MKLLSKTNIETSELAAGFRKDSCLNLQPDVFLSVGKRFHLGHSLYLGSCAKAYLYTP